MFYIQTIHRGWNKPISIENHKSDNSKIITSQPLASESETAKSSKFASQKTQEYIHNAQRAYIYERGILF